MEPNNFPVKDLLQKFLDGTITETESEALFAWLKENPAENNPEVEQVLEKNYQRAFEEQPALTPAAGNRILHRLLDSTAAPVMPIRRRWLPYAAAAAILLLATTATLIIRHPKKVTPMAVNITKSVKPGNHAYLTLADGKQIQLDSAYGNIVQHQGLEVDNNKGELDYKGKAGNVELHTLSTPKGGQYRLMLPDGTAVWLNAESSITFPTAFNGKFREVKMTGEVYFDVKQAANHPFMVTINDKTTVEVLGTAFNVNAYTDEPTIRTTLIQGSVRMIHDKASNVLQPGQQGVISHDQLNVNSNVDIEMVVAWKEGLFRFDRTPVDIVLRQLSRWYDVDVVYEKNVPSILFSGEIKRDLDLNQALTVLSTMGVHYKIDGRKLVIMP
ncbi:MAG: FecR domain-containing protein [Chitinophaga sp.]|uniref:FecR family protein n=1 Tax=Chitinophaga sp. TaxID=1869181 RepID=UPI0025BEA84C|nr:FecR family protein [Chitinophaga sp.]MBV8251906.1 FecR domain-containing protein [Chitinophaga sp.]